MFRFCDTNEDRYAGPRQSSVPIYQDVTVCLAQRLGFLYTATSCCTLQGNPEFSRYVADANTYEGVSKSFRTESIAK